MKRKYYYLSQCVLVFCDNACEVTTHGTHVLASISTGNTFTLDKDSPYPVTSIVWTTEISYVACSLLTIMKLELEKGSLKIAVYLLGSYCDLVTRQ